MMTEFVIPALFPQAPLTKTLTIDPAVLKNYVGEYEHKWFQITASVMIKDKKLIIVSRGLEKIELVPTAKTAFHGMIEKIGPIEVNFSKNDNGIVNDMIMRIGFTNMLFDKIK
jgi:hypothetical protein